MNRNNKVRLQRVQRDIKPILATYFPSLSKKLDLGINVHMFTEDIPLAIMPIGGRVDKRKEFSVEFLGESLDCEKAKKIICELGKSARRDNAGILCDAVDKIARHMVWEGQAVFEISRDGEHIYINSFTSKNLFKLFNWYLQIIPPKDWDFWKRKLIFVAMKKIWKVSMPYKLGGVRGYKKILRKLKKYNHLGPDFYKQDIERGIAANEFHFSKYVKSSEIYLDKTTLTWGWNRRDWSLEKYSEYYSFYKMLSFRHAQAILREHIINEINLLLTRLSINCQIVVTGLPTAKEILQIRSDMQKGKLYFSEASDKVAM